MRRWQTWTHHLATLAVGGSGVSYWLMKNLMTSTDPFAVANHPLQPTMFSLHVFTAPLLVFLFGLMFESHIQRKLRAANTENRKSGIAAAVTFGVMTVSGYGLQVSTGELARQAALVLHLSSSAVFLLAYGAHQFVHYRMWRAGRAARGVAYEA
jgi:hypothetical protein